MVILTDQQMQKATEALAAARGQQSETPSEAVTRYFHDKGITARATPDLTGRSLDGEQAPATKDRLAGKDI